MNTGNLSNIAYACASLYFDHSLTTRTPRFFELSCLTSSYDGIKVLTAVRMVPEYIQIVDPSSKYGTDVVSYTAASLLYSYQVLPAKFSPSCAFHGSEMNYVFDTLRTVYGQDPGAVANWMTEDYALGDMMSSLWANFINSHDPNAGNLTGWEVSSLNSTTTYQLGANRTMIPLVDNLEKISLIEKWYSMSTRVF